MSGKLYIVGTPIGNLSDFSPRAIETLEKVDFLAVEDTRVTVKLLNHFEIKKEMLAYYEHNKNSKGNLIIQRLLNGESCALVSDAGMPAISDPGEDLVRAAYENGIEVEQDGVGELCLKGDGVMECYYNDPDATAKSLKDGWLYTGDMATRDADGFIFLVDRKKDVIITGGENLYPVQIEDFIRGFNKVHDVAVIGLADERLGEIAAAVIKIKDGMTCTEEEINDFCKGMPRYKRPRKIIFADVPRNPTGKIEKPKLREIYCGESLVASQNEIKK